MKNILKKIWQWYCNLLILFVCPDYPTVHGPSLLEWCFKGFLFNVVLVGVIHAACFAVFVIIRSLCIWPLTTSCVVGAVFLFGVVLPLLVRKSSK